MDIHMIEFIGFFPPIVRYLLVIFVIVPVFLRIVKSIYELNEGLVWKKTLSRLEYLSKSTNIDPELSGYLDSLRNAEVFRLASGIDVSANLSRALMKIYQKGFVSRKNLKRVVGYIDLGRDDKVKVEVSFFERCCFAYSLIASIILFILGIAVCIYYLHYLKLLYEMAGFISFLILLLLTVFVIRDFVTSRILDRVQKKLKEYEMLEEPAAKVYFPIFRWFYR
jgi:hypothetical protein